MTAPSTDELTRLLAECTPGPWRILDETDCHCDADGNAISMAVGKRDNHAFALSMHPHSGERCEANAELIAAAPTIAADLIALRKAAEGMAEALRKALNYLENTEGEFGITLISGDACRAALAAYEELKP